MKIHTMRNQNDFPLYDSDGIKIVYWGKVGPQEDSIESIPPWINYYGIAYWNENSQTLIVPVAKDWHGKKKE